MYQKNGIKAKKLLDKGMIFLGLSSSEMLEVREIER